MKIVIANTDLMVSKLIEACAKKTGLQVQHFISLEEVDSSMLEDCFLFVDENALGSDTKRAKQIGTESLSCLIYSRRKPLNEFKYLVQKPFLPTQILELLRKELVNRGEDFNRAVEEEQKTPIEPIKDIPLNEFDLKDEHLFEGNLELPPLPDTDAVETKTSAQSAKEQKEQVDEEENFLEVGENIEHKSLAALEREKSGASVDDLGGNDLGAVQDISSEPDFLSEPASVDALGGESAGQYSAEPNELDSALDIRESLAGDLDSIDENSLDNSLGDSLDSSLDGQLDSLDKLDDLGTASVLGNLDGLGGTDSAPSADFGADSSVASSDVSERDELLGDDIGSDEGLSGDLGADLGESASAGLGVDLDKKQDDLASLDSLDDSLDGLDISSEVVANETTDDIAGVADSASGTNGNVEDLPQESQESSLDFTAQGGVLDKDEAQEIQDLLAENAGAQVEGLADSANSADEIAGLADDIDEAKGAESADSAEISADSDLASEALAGISDEGASKESQEFIGEEIGSVEASEPSAQQEAQAPIQESTQEESAQENAKEASEGGEFADLSESDIMEVLGEEDLGSDLASGVTLDKEALAGSEKEPLSDLGVAEQGAQNTQDSSQESVVETPQESITDASVEDTSVAEVAKEQISDEVAQSLAPQEASAGKEVSTQSIQDEVIKDLQENLEQDLQKSLEEETPTVLQNDLAEGEPPSESHNEISQVDEAVKDEASSIDKVLELADLSEQTESQVDETQADAKESSTQDSKEDLANEMGLDSVLENDLQDLAQDDLSKDLAASGLEEGGLQTDNIDSADSAEAGSLDDISLEESESSDLEASSLDDVDMPKTELPKSLEELENLIESKDSISGLDTAIAELDTSLEKVVAQDFDTKDSSLDFGSSVESSSKDSTKSSSAKSTQKRLITELLANKSAEEISSLLEGAHIRIDIDFSQD
ncbi:midas domain-containing protein [Helicobacter macacae]|uniref:Poly E-rich protein n=1 Tax=Helicobacter macacae MIT 99-5501 TaxID=1357400 RepID=V8C8X2_9HELI|nr:hypothetical protein [Helicobacter macacae]ETD23435.1 hypothetical protein HMPREF2086_01238 [Helicobacter macacae MIT 99-5501]